jgi:hypothetical protein
MMTKPPRIALDSQNDSYILGYSQSPNYPVTSNAYQQQRANPTQFIYNVVLTKIDSSGFLLFSTFLGGSTDDTSGGIVLDSQGNAYITGFTLSSDFPGDRQRVPDYVSELALPAVRSSRNSAPTVPRWCIHRFLEERAEPDHRAPLPLLLSPATRRETS